MVTVVNSPQASGNSGGPIGIIIVLVVLLIIGYFGYVYGLPAIRQSQMSSPQINVPNEIDVNIKQTE